MSVQMLVGILENADSNYQIPNNPGIPEIILMQNVDGKFQVAGYTAIGAIFIGVLGESRVVKELSTTFCHSFMNMWAAHMHEPIINSLTDFLVHPDKQIWKILRELNSPDMPFDFKGIAKVLKNLNKEKKS